MFHKSILVLTDNLIMADHFQTIFEGMKSVPKVKYAVSPASDKMEFSQKLGVSIEKINLKDNATIDWIKNCFSLVISMHCKQLFPPDLTGSVKCINVHPGLNPYTRGWYPQVFAIINDLPIGATIHEMDEQLDHGNIIGQIEVKKELIDTSLTLYNKVLKAEVNLLKKHLLSIIENTYTISAPDSEGELFLKRDFKNLCEIELDQVSTALDFLNHLRALTHGDFNNAYFINPESGRKVYVKISLTEDES